ncbi:MAG: hypothetical protein ABIQ39_05975, partial [Ilumatobacteraceae bacterium]
GGAATALPACTTGSPCTIADLIAVYPHIGIHPTQAAIGFKAGSGSSPLTGNVDDLKIGISGDITTFDFEPETQCTTDCFVNAATGNDAFGGEVASNPKKTIQAAIDTVNPGGTVHVAPGNYTETASNRTPSNLAGSYQFGLFFPSTKAGVTLEGDKADGTPNTDPTSPTVFITTNSTANFGPDGIFVDADDVTVSGVQVNGNIGGDNKTFEVAGDNFTLKNSRTNIPDGGGSVYFNDFTPGGSRLKAYHVEGNIFPDGTSVDLTNGAGLNGPVADRTITNNVFDTLDNGFAAVSFNGPSSGGPGWYVLQVGGAVIAGNTFKAAEFKTDGTLVSSQYIRSRGTVHESEFDWASYWNDNTFDRAAVALSDVSSFAVRSYDYSSGPYSFQYVRRISGTIQGSVSDAQPGDSVLVARGTYTAATPILISKPLSLLGPNHGISPNDSTSPVSPNAGRSSEATIAPIAGAEAIRVGAGSVTIDGFRFTDPGTAGVSTKPIIGAGGNFGGDSSGYKVINNRFDGISRTALNYNGPERANGGAVNDNRVFTPTRAQGCGNGPLADTSCGHQLFNPWRTMNLEVQRNVVIGALSNGDGVRVLGIDHADATEGAVSTVDNIVIEGNVVRDACTEFCFQIAAASNVVITGNDISVDAGAAIRIHELWANSGLVIDHNTLKAPTAV